MPQVLCLFWDYVVCTFTVHLNSFLSVHCNVEQKKKLKKGKKEEKAAEKPDTFTEKLVSHLVKNLVVRRQCTNFMFAGSSCSSSSSADNV